MRRTVLQMGHPLLRVKAQAVPRAAITQQHARELMQCLETTMRAEHGLGIAAPQVGVTQRVMLIDWHALSHDMGSACGVEEERLLMELWNPQLVVKKQAKMQYAMEGCLSVPGYMGWVPRHCQVVATFHDHTGTKRRLRATGYAAAVLQHEADHLDGVLWVDRVDPRVGMSTVAESDSLPVPEGAVGVGADPKDATAMKGAGSLQWLDTPAME